MASENFNAELISRFDPSCLSQDELEAARIESLRRSGLLDTPPEAEFDDLVRIASTICHAPMASLTLIDTERQWFKARIGIEATETPIEQSFCKYVVQKPDVMVVPDATKDERFADNPMVLSDPNIRFYAGAPVEDEDGVRIGSLCVIDSVPREITPEERDALAVLGRVASRQLLLRHLLKEQEATLNRARDAEQKLQVANDRFTAFMDNNPAIAFLKDNAGRYIYVNRALKERFKDRADEWVGKKDSEIWSPELARRVQALDARVLAGDDLVQTEQEITLDGETQNWLTYRFPVVEANGDRLLAGMGLDISERVAAQREADAVRASLAARVEELQERTHQLMLIGEMGEILQSCRNFEEATGVVVRSLQRLFPYSGALYLLSASQTLIEASASWGQDELASAFTPDECWGMRRGRMHVVNETGQDLICRHVEPTSDWAYICAPLVAQREVSGLLHLRGPANYWTEDRQQLVRTIAEQIALAFANLKLQEKLRNQSIRDALTGLYNRRYLEESLEREIHRAERGRHPLSVIMFDIDHFKRFNDTFGHEAGDLLLREMGACVTGFVRKSDIACRYGGEEFALLLPELGKDEAVKRAEKLLNHVRELEVKYRRQALGKVTISAGVATYPQDADTGTDLLNTADKALYIAKRGGRNQVIRAEKHIGEDSVDGVFVGGASADGISADGTAEGTLVSGFAPTTAFEDR